MSQNNSVGRVEDTMFPSLELLEFTSGFHLPCVAFISRNHDKKLCGWSVDKSWLIVQALPPVPEKPGLIHCNFAETEMASSLTWCCLNWENEFSPLTKARKELSPYTSHFLCHLWLGNGCTVTQIVETPAWLLWNMMCVCACVHLSYGLTWNLEAAVSQAFAKNQMKSSQKISYESQGYFVHCE